MTERAETAQTAEARTRRWLQDWVLGLNLCPFAGPVIRDNSLRISVCLAGEVEQQLQSFLAELDKLQRSPEEQVSTILLVFAAGPADFRDFLELLALAQHALESAGLEGVIQLASFHPHYLFAGEDPTAVSHFTNRSPLPVIHLLREDMLARQLALFPDAEQIPFRNIEMLETLGSEAVVKLWQDTLGSSG